MAAAPREPCEASGRRLSPSVGPRPHGGATASCSWRWRRVLAATLLAAGALCSGACLTARDPSGGPSSSSAPPVEAPRGPASSAGQDLAAVPPAAQRYAALTRLLARSLQRAGEDCGAVAAAVEGWTASHGAELRDLQRAVDAWESRSRRPEIDRYYAVVFPDIEVRIDAAIRCHDHSVARAAYDRFFAAVGLDDQ